MLRKGAIALAAVGAALVMSGQVARAADPHSPTATRVPATPGPVTQWYATMCDNPAGLDLARCAYVVSQTTAVETPAPKPVPGAVAGRGHIIESVGGATEIIGGTGGQPVQTITFNDGGPRLITF